MAVMRSYQYSRSIKTYETLPKIKWSDYKTVILNGEGTMHHSKPTAMKFLRALQSAHGRGCDIQIHNTVWQEMCHTYDDVLRKCSQITVREVLSQQEIFKHGIYAPISPDRSMIVDVPYKEYDHVNIYDGQTFNKSIQRQSDRPRINIFEQSWDEIVNRLRNADLLITGRHHEMYAAIKAKCKFIVEEGNTWKNRGLLQTVGASIDCNDIEGILNGKYDVEYEKIFQYCLYTK
jgi:hypothetical protein